MLLITGKVVDSNNEPLQMVNIWKTNQPTVGTITNGFGNYSIMAAPGEMLSFSYVGHKPVTRIVTGAGPLNVVLQEDFTLDEVVVTGTPPTKQTKSFPWLWVLAAFVGTVAIASNNKQKVRA